MLFDQWSFLMQARAGWVPWSGAGGSSVPDAHLSSSVAGCARVNLVSNDSSLANYIIWESLWYRFWWLIGVVSLMDETIE